MRHVRLAFLAVLALASASAPLHAQRARTSSASRPNVWELGLDAALSFGLDTPKSTRFSIPVSNVRAGIFTTDVIEIEPFLSLQYIKPEGSGAVTAYNFGTGLLYHFSPDRAKSQVYVRPFLDIAGFSGGGTSDSNVGAGVGVGMKWPRMNGRFAWRGEFNVASMNDNTSLNLLWGLSYFTR